MQRNSLQQYRQIGVQTARPEQVLLMLYDGAINFCERARLAYERGDLATGGPPVGRCQAILFELLSTLDRRHSPELCANLERLYAYMIRRLGEAQVARDATIVAEVKQLLSTLRDGWAGAIAQMRITGEPPAAGSAR
jgi:flagellar protein FliS